MNRRKFLTSVAALRGAAMFPEPLAESEQQITHVDTKTSGPLRQSAVVKAAGIRREGAAPGAKAYVQFNGPTGAARRACLRVRDAGTRSTAPSSSSPS